MITAGSKPKRQEGDALADTLAVGRLRGVLDVGQSWPDDVRVEIASAVAWVIAAIERDEDRGAAGQAALKVAKSKPSVAAEMWSARAASTRPSVDWTAPAWSARSAARGRWDFWQREDARIIAALTALGEQ